MRNISKKEFHSDKEASLYNKRISLSFYEKKIK